MNLPFSYRDPASAIAEFEQILASNSGEDPFDCAIKLLAAKLVDELENKSVDSSFQIHKTPDSTYRVVQALYRQAIRRWPLLNGAGADLDISPQHLVRSMRPLVGWRLVESDLSWLDAALERLVAKDAKGALGQYFTPREIVRFCIEVLNPNPKDKVIDPACGSGGFLFESTGYSLRKFGAAPSCLGIDFGARAIKVAALLAEATTKAKIVVSKANSIDGRAYSDNAPPEWSPFLSRETGSSTRRAASWGAWNALSCTVAATNPPFAGAMDEADVLDAYESQGLQTGRAVVSREHLFLERTVQMLRPQGRMAIVLPQGLLANPSAAYLRAWLLRKCRILGVVGLHAHAFLPYTSVKTALLFAVKLRENEQTPSDYPIFFVSSQDAGKDSRGRATGKADYSDIAATFGHFLASQPLPWAAPASTRRGTSEFEAVPLSEVVKADRLDSEYYDPKARALVRRLGAKTMSQVGSLVESRLERFKRALFKDIQYIDISSVDSKTGLVVPTVMSSNEAPSRASYVVQPGDVLVSTVRPDRNVVALVSEAGGGPPMVASNGFCVLRPKTIAPEVLFAYCKTSAFRRMLSRHATASMYPTVTDKDVLSMPFIEPSREASERVKKLIGSSLQMIERARHQLSEAATLMTSYVEEPSSDEIESPRPVVQQSKRSYRAKRKKN